MKISVFSPVKNEVDFAGYSIMSALPHVHEILYGLAECDDGTLELLQHIKAQYAGDKLKLFTGQRADEPNWNFDPLDMAAYDASYNFLIKEATGDALWFLHPDMIVTNPEAIAEVPEDALAWWTHIDSYAGDLQTKIVAGRAKRWKNIQSKKFGLHYYGGYGSQNEDMYFADITGSQHRHYGEDFAEYPFEIKDSGIRVNHYCELKSYARRFEKMARCLKTLFPQADQKMIDQWAAQHPRVTLEPGPSRFGRFEFGQADNDVPSVFHKYKDEFESFKKIGALTHG